MEMRLPLRSAGHESGPSQDLIHFQARQAGELLKQCC
ncbi:hypothetical protein SMAC4_13117 [Sordaria macrospora]|nr:hypothetical protein SMAC4_13117 [Sordaria macrospora]